MPKDKDTMANVVQPEPKQSVEEQINLLSRDTQLAFMYPDSIELDGRCKPIAQLDGMCEGRDD